MNKHLKRGIALLLVGVLLLCGALVMHFAQQWEDRMAGETANSLLQQLDLNRITLNNGQGIQNPQAPQLPQEQPEYSVEDVQMPPQDFLGYTLSGSLRIDSVGIHLPILRDWNYDMLKIAPCRYKGSISGGNLVIMGHNYKSHFTPLHSIKAGDEVVFENTQGKAFRYQVAQIEYLQRHEGERLDSEYPLTLFTCTPGGLQRIVVRCDYAK